MLVSGRVIVLEDASIELIVGFVLKCNTAKKRFPIDIQKPAEKV